MSSPALLLCLSAPWYIVFWGDVTTLPYFALRNLSRPFPIPSASYYIVQFRILRVRFGPKSF